VILELGTTPVVPQIRKWLRGVDLNHRPLGYEPNELPDCSTPHFDHNNRVGCRQTSPQSARAGRGVRAIWLPECVAHTGLTPLLADGSFGCVIP
jgi:hypothetical protein